MFKNTSGQTLTLSAFDSATGTQKTGDAANILMYVDIDDAGPNTITSNSGVPTEIDSTKSKGDYKIVLSQSETNGNKLHFTGKSTTSGIVVVSKTIYTVPANFTALNVSTDGKMLLGTSQTLTTLNCTTANFTTQNTVTSNCTTNNMTTLAVTTRTFGGATQLNYPFSVYDGVCVSTTSASQITFTGTIQASNISIGMGITIMTSSVGAQGQTRRITTMAQVSSNVLVAFDRDFLVAPANGDTFAITNDCGPSLVSIATANGGMCARSDVRATRGAILPTNCTAGYMAIDLNSVSGSNVSLTLANTTIGHVTLADTITTYTGDTPQTGDSFARIGATGSGLTSLAPSSTALSTAVWTAPPTGFLSATFPGGTMANTTNVTSATGVILGATGLAAITSWSATVSNVTTVASVTGAVALTSGERNSVADALLNRDMSAVSVTNSRSPINALRLLRNKWGIVGTTLTVCAENDSDVAWTGTVTASPGADPISGNDPS